ncbi:MAG TPA: DUF2842 domain-containing protein [Rhizobiales bacterium]|nr:hypothetical protein BMS3Bbin10_00810 [bacterium BMS3Bbin10]HDO51901.1 DUF2842 domain-containing protein [Hyphomicrobiales bacterium]
MKIRTRKFVGTVTLILFLTTYSLVAMAFAASRVVGLSPIVEAVFFLVAGLVWVIPAGILIRWMQRPDPS